MNAPGYCSEPGCDRPAGRTGKCEACEQIARDKLKKKNRPQKERAYLQRGGPPKKISEKRQEEMKDYSTLRKQYLKENPVCEANLRECTGMAEEIHHKAKRGANYLNVETFMAVCKPCHKIIEEKMSAEERREQGFLMTVSPKPTI